MWFNKYIAITLAHEGKDLGGVTREVISYKITINGINFKICDSPGLQNITEKNNAITEN